jgi:site-specific DNA-methyltransferase (adenine-specific)
MKFVTDLSKGILGQPDSPEMWTEIISHIPDAVLLKPDVKILSVACGHCTEAVIIAKRMMALGISKEKVRDSIWLIDKYQVFTNHARMKYGFKEDQIITGDFSEWKTNMNFDVIVGNPPYQDGDREEQANKLWPQFVKKSTDLSNNNGYIALVTPNGWMQPTADIGKGTGKNALSIFNDIFKKNNLILANIDSDAIRENYFKGVGSTFSYYIFQKTQYSGITTLVTPSGQIQIDINKIESLPKVTSPESLSISSKMVGTPFTFCDQNHGLGGSESSVKGTSVSGKNKQLINHKYKVYHTNKGGGTYWFSEKLNPYATTPKVIISLSGSYLPVFNKTEGFSNMCVAIICDTDKAAQSATQVLSSKLYKFWVDMQKFSGFNPRKLILSLPKVDLTRSWTDAELYKHFNLTQEEIDYIEKTVK